MLANSAIEGQQTDEPEDPNRDHNLWEPIPGDHGAHGSFDDQATYSSPQVWLSLHRDEILKGALALGGLVLGGLLASKWSNGEDED